MAKVKSSFVCSSCGAQFASWSGKCGVCGEWNTLEQAIVQQIGKVQQAISSGTALKPQRLVLIDAKNNKTNRISAGILDIDAVLGGGIVPASVMLLAGQPGIGKSTLILQIAMSISKGNSVLYISGEESIEQVSLRSMRIDKGSTQMSLVTSSSANDIATTIAQNTYDVVIVDSIQTVATSEIAGVPGSVSQVTNSAQLITNAAKSTKTAVILVGHVTKEGSIAGPKVLEHLVDVVLQLEGDRYGDFRVLRAIKNRYGSTNEAALLEMHGSGLKIVENPSAVLLEERQVSDGSVVTATLEGTRPVLVEVQALVNNTSFGYPKRAASGFDLSRLNLLVAMLERRTKLSLSDKDIYINVVGGIKLTEPAADLAVCMAIASAAKHIPLAVDAVCFGEVGLSGEIRHIPWIDKRVSEAIKMGFKRVIGPKPPANLKNKEVYLISNNLKNTLNSAL
ncbi:MAG: DNA repair protein RadA [Patescibacteria group bacterium]|jgi:DNA repair protein RadA/Sms|nr:DNA repair protein RadA [Patescibacteria group bacterium]